MCALLTDGNGTSRLWIALDLNSTACRTLPTCPPVPECWDHNNSDSHNLCSLVRYGSYCRRNPHQGHFSVATSLDLCVIWSSVCLSPQQRIHLRFPHAVELRMVCLGLQRVAIKSVQYIVSLQHVNIFVLRPLVESQPVLYQE